MVKITCNGAGTAKAEFPAVVMTVVTDPEEIASFQARQAKFDRNCGWFETHGSEIFAQHRGKYVCVAGQQLFVADSALEALDLARAAHPEDDGRFFKYIPKDKYPRIYAN